MGVAGAARVRTVPASHFTSPSIMRMDRLGNVHERHAARRRNRSHRRREREHTVALLCVVDRWCTDNEGREIKARGGFERDVEIGHGILSGDSEEPLLDRGVVGPKREDDPRLSFGRQPSNRFLLPAIQDIRRGVPSDSEVVSGHREIGSERGRDRPSDPTQTRRVAHTRHQRVAEEQHPYVTHARSQSDRGPVGFIPACGLEASGKALTAIVKPIMQAAGVPGRALQPPRPAHIFGSLWMAADRQLAEL